MITLVGAPWADTWLNRIDTVDQFVAMPDHPLTGCAGADESAWTSFVTRMRSLRLDLAVQLHGSGRLSNEVVSQWGARHVLAFQEPLQRAHLPSGALSVLWPERGSEVSRLMQLLRILGWPSEQPPDMHLVHPVTDADRQSALNLLRARGMPPGRTSGWICVHVGSKWGSRRWPVERFAAVASELAQRGHVIVLTGSEQERDFIAPIVQRVPQAIDLCGLTDLWTLGAVIDGAMLLLCNDTGVSHVAAARKVPSVVVSCGSDVARWSPADAVRHRVLWSAPPCRPCMHTECPQTRHICALDIDVGQVLMAVTSALHVSHQMPR